MNYLLIGPEEYLKEKFLEKLKSSILPSKDSSLDFDVFQAGISEMGEVLNSFNTLPFFSKHRLAVIKNIDKFSSKEKDLILKYLKKPVSSTTLVLESPSSELNKFLKEVSKSTKLTSYKKLRGRELTAWIKKEFAFYKKRISQDAVKLIENLKESDLTLLKSEIEKTVTFSGKKQDVTLRDVETILGKDSYKTIFEIVDMVVEKKVDRIFKFLEALLVKEKPNQVLNLLAWQFRNFIKIKDSKGDTSVESIAKLLNTRWGFAKRILTQSKNFSREELKNNLEIILEADSSLKTGKFDPQHALERALVGLCRSTS